VVSLPSATSRGDGGGYMLHLQEVSVDSVGPARPAVPHRCRFGREIGRHRLEMPPGGAGAYDRGDPAVGLDLVPSRLESRWTDPALFVVSGALREPIPWP
jgi:hypothetical protein